MNPSNKPPSMNIARWFQKKTPLAMKICLLVYLAAFLVAFFNHSMDLLRGGFFPYEAWNPRVPGWLNVYWTMLTFLDLAAIIFLLVRVEAGFVLSLVIIVSDVVINFTFISLNDGPLALINVFQMGQFSFLIFVLATFRPLFRWSQLLPGRRP